MSMPATRLLVAAVAVLAASIAVSAATETPRTQPPVTVTATLSREQTQDRSDRALDFIRQSDPNKAKSLEQLRKTDPNQFNREVREFFRSRRPTDLGPGFFDFGDMGRGGGQGGPGGGGRPDGPDGMRNFGPRPDFQGPDMEKEKEEFGKWLKANYPEMEKKFLDIKKLDPKQVDRRTMSEFRPYIGLYFASKFSPKLAEILKQDIPLRNQRRELINSINKTTDAAAKAKLTAELRTVVEKRFDLLVQQKQLEYDTLMQWLKDLEKRIKDSKSGIDDMKQNATKHIDKQMQDLLIRRDRSEGRPGDKPQDKSKDAPPAKP
jgi:hypothetical protein